MGFLEPAADADKNAEVEAEEAEQRMLMASITLLLLLLLPLLFWFQDGYHAQREVPKCDAPVVLDQLRNTSLGESLFTAIDSIQSVALDPVLGHRICLATLASAGGKGSSRQLKFAVSVTDRLPSLLRVEAVSD